MLVESPWQENQCPDPSEAPPGVRDGGSPSRRPGLSGLRGWVAVSHGTEMAVFKVLPL